MSDNDTTAVSHTCAVTGEESGGKHYILRSTEGEELVSPDALFGGGNSDVLERHVKKLEERIQRVEKWQQDRAEAAAAKPAAKKTAAAAKSAE